MQVSIEATTGLERKMSVSVPAGRVEDEVEKRLKNLARTVKMKGFRPGKIPIKVVEDRYGSRVRQEVINEITQSTFYEALVKENLQLANLPRFEPKVVEPGHDLQYDAVFEIMAKIQIASPGDIQIERPVAEVTPGDVDNMLETLRKNKKEWVQVERAAASDDQVVIDFRGTIDGEPFDGGEGHQVPVALGSKTFIPGFEDQLVGAKAGEARTVDVTFPDDYHAAHLAGKAAQFAVTVHRVSEARLPDLDAVFASHFDVPDIEALRVEVRKTMEEELKENVRELVKRQVMDALLKNNQVETPKSQVEAEIDLMMRQTQETLNKQGVSAEQIRLERGMFEEQAKRRIALGMIISEIARENQFQVQPDQVKKRVEGLAASYDDPDEVVKWYYADRNRLLNVESLVLEDMVIDWVMQSAKVTDRPSSFSEVAAQRRG